MKNTGKKILGVLATLSAVFCFSSCEAFFESLTSITSTSNSSTGTISSEQKISLVSESESESEEKSSSSKESSEQSSQQSVVSTPKESVESAVHSDSTSEPSENLPQEPFSFLLKATETKYGYQALSKESDGEGLCAYYQDIYDGLAEFFLSEEDVAKVSAGNTQVYRIGEFNYAKHGLTQAKANAVLKTIRLDYPEFYWLDNTFYQGGTSLYLQIDQEYAKAETRRELEVKLLDMVDSCGEYLQGLNTQLERALTIYDFVTATITYAYKADGETPEDAPWAHNLEGWTMGKAVCETYAEVYTWLCEIYSVPCITVVGVAGGNAEEMGGHAWNIVAIDGKWYTVDSTWGDQDTKGFLLREWFGKNPTEFAQTHIADTPKTWGKSWQAELPALADESLYPVLLSEDGGEEVLYANPDYAFEQMRNAKSRYEMKLYAESAVTVDMGITIYPKGAKFFTKALPAVKQIAISSKVIWKGVGDNQKGYLPEITAENGLELSCLFVISQVKLITPTLDGERFVMKKGEYATIEIKKEENS